MNARPIIKICGVTRPEDAVAAVELGADLLGLNFYGGSSRCVELARAREIAAAVGRRRPLVGVFVDAPLGVIEESVEAVGLDLVQLHGDEAPELAAALGPQAIRAFRVGEGLDAAALDAYPGVWGFLFDGGGTGLYGGSGREWGWGRLAGLRTAKPWLVAGGIRPGNARRALTASGAHGVDVCTGVESAPGRKDRSRMERLFEEVHHGQG